MQVYLLGAAGLLLMLFITMKYYNSKLQSENYKLTCKLDLIYQECERLFAQNSQIRQESNQAIEDKYLAQQKEALALQKCEAMKEQIESWEKHKQQSIENAKAAIFDVGNKLSNQLISEAKRENDQHKEESQKHFKATTDKLYQDFSKLTEVISNLKEQVNISQNTTDVVYKALLAPNTVGSLAELTLENILKSSNLIANVDYQMQYSIFDQDNNRLRPDAVIFLPGDNILVIDSKASKFFLELGQAKNEVEAEEIKKKLKTTMRNHLKSLASKDYRQAITSHLQKKNINHISTIMFLPTETSLEKLQAIDSQLIADAWQNNIFPAGPVGLVNILSHSKFQISEESKSQNYHAIINEVSSLLYNIANLAGHAKKLGNSIYNSMNYFDKFAASFNSNLISKSKRIETLGVHVKTNKLMPERIDRYQVIMGQKLTMIEGEKEEKDEEIVE
ncbi:MAG: DNA recombination protein RmuC [Rickettsiales bacterium]